MMKETLPFSRGREKEGLVYSLDVPCLAEQSRQAHPVHQSHGGYPPPKQHPQSHNQRLCSAAPWEPREQEGRGTLLSALLCLGTKSKHASYTSRGRGWTNVQLKASGKDSGLGERDSIRGIQDGEKERSEGGAKETERKGRAGGMDGGQGAGAPRLAGGQGRAEGWGAPPRRDRAPR